MGKSLASGTAAGFTCHVQVSEIAKAEIEFFPILSVVYPISVISKYNVN
jgi:hypothetical protein